VVHKVYYSYKNIIIGEKLRHMVECQVRKFCHVLTVYAHRYVLLYAVAASQRKITSHSAYMNIKLER